MGKQAIPMPSLWRLHELFLLSDKYPSGLEWRVHKARYKPGDQAGRLHKGTGYYMVGVDNQVYLAHRIVEYMRNETDLSNCTVTHSRHNKEKDNRQQLIVTSLKPVVQKNLEL